MLRAAFPAGSHDEKALVEIIETYPRDELFQISIDDLYRIAIGILHLGARQRLRLFFRRDTFDRFISCLVFVPRDRFNTENRGRIEGILRRATNATSRIGDLATTDAVRVPVASRPISPNTSPGPSCLTTTPPLCTSASPASITNSS